MTDSELITVRTDLHERGYPADDWTDAEIEALPRWTYSNGWMFAVLGDTSTDFGDVAAGSPNGWRYGDASSGVDFPSYSEAIEHAENNRPCNRLAILHLLEQETAK